MKYDGLLGSAFWLGVLFLVASIWLVFGTGGAWPHSWYPDACCHGRDCYSAAPAEVVVRPDGYWLPEDALLIPFGDSRIRLGNEGHDFHICRNFKSHAYPVKCIFPPGPGM